jgi:hypothetical protein
VSIDDDLHERLEAAFGTITPHPAPIDDAIRGGRVIKGRRRLALAVGAGTVAVAAVFSIPALLHQTAAPAPAAPEQQHYTVTVQAPGPGWPPGVIAVGTLNGQRWWIIADRPGADFDHPGQQDIIIAGPAVGTPGGSDQYVPPLSVAGGLGPVSFIGITSGSDQIQVGAVQADVSYVTVRLGNGTVLVLHPVTVYGTRAVALALPMHAEIIEVTAYSRHGEIASAIPFNSPGGMAWVVSWLRPGGVNGVAFSPDGQVLATADAHSTVRLWNPATGQTAAPRVSGVIGSGTIHGQAWSATAHLGPWGTCIALAGGAGSGGLCVPALSGVSAVETLNPGGSPLIAGGVVPTSVTRVAVTESDGTTAQARLVTVGGLKAFAFALRPGCKPLRWVAYDGAGSVVASSSPASRG